MILRTFVIVAAIAAPLRAAPQDDTDAAAAVRAFFAGLTGEFEADARTAGTLVARGPDVIPPLLAGLGDRPLEEKLWGIRCLRELKARDATPVLLGFARSEDAALRREALAALARLGGEGTADVFLPLARDPDPEVRRRAFEALAAVRPLPEAAALAAAGALADPDYWVRLKAGDVIQALPAAPGSATGPLLDALGAALLAAGPDSAGRIVDFLVVRGAPVATKHLVAALTCPEPDVRRFAVSGLARLKAVDEVEAILPLLRADEPPVAIAALDALAKLRARTVLGKIIDILEASKHPKVRDAAAVALRRITGKAWGFDIARWRAFAEQG